MPKAKAKKKATKPARRKASKKTTKKTAAPVKKMLFAAPDQMSAQHPHGLGDAELIDHAHLQADHKGAVADPGGTLSEESRKRRFKSIPG